MRKWYLFSFLLIPVFSYSQFTYHAGFSLGYSGFDGGNSIAADAVGNVYVVGSYETYLDIDPGAGVTALNSNGGADAFLAKYSSAGSLIWGKSIGGTMGDGASEIKLDDAGNIYITGSFQGTVDFGGGPITAQGTDIYVAKFDNLGQHIWSKSFGGTDDESAYSIRPSGNGNTVAICGSFRDVIDFGTGPITCLGSTNAYVALLDTNGNTLWAYGFGGNGFALDRAVTVIQDNAGNVYATGTISGSNVDLDPTAGTHFASSTGSGDIFITKFDASGTFLDAFTLGGAKGEFPGGLAVNAGGDIYLTGYSNSDSIDVDPGVGFHYLYGQTAILFVQDIILIKFNAAMQFQWGFRIGKRASDVGHDLTLDANENVYITGGMGDSLVDFDPGPNTYFLNGDSVVLESVPFVAEYTPNGDLVDAFSLPGEGLTPAIDVANDGKVWIAGSFYNASIDIDPGAGSVILNNAGQFDAFVAGYNPANAGIDEYQQYPLRIFPNPCSNYFTIGIEQAGDMEVKVYEITGKLVGQFKTKSGGQVNVKNLASGMYFISARHDGRNFFGRLVKH